MHEANFPLEHVTYHLNAVLHDVTTCVWASKRLFFRVELPPEWRFLFRFYGDTAALC